jgi:hypothetical protein
MVEACPTPILVEEIIDRLSGKMRQKVNEGDFWKLENAVQEAKRRLMSLTSEPREQPEWTTYPDLGEEVQC